MATYPVVAYPYLGSLLSVNLLSSSTTILLSAFGSSTVQSLVDDGTRLFVGEPVSIGGNQYEFVGSGTAQPGINFLGLTIPTGFAVDLLLVRDVGTGQLHFVFPDGVPNATGMIAMVISLQPIGYDLNTNGPLCFASGTMIETLTGPVVVESLQPGALLRSPDGPPLRLLANIPAEVAWVSPAAQLPVVIHANAFQPGLPNRDLLVSQQHGIAISGSRLELDHGVDAALAPAMGLVDFQRVTIGHDFTAPRYRHLMCDRHGLVFANGVLAETLLWSDRARANMPLGAVDNMAPADLLLAAAQTLCLPRLSVTETRLLTHGKRKLRPILGALTAKAP